MDSFASMRLFGYRLWAISEEILPVFQILFSYNRCFQCTFAFQQTPIRMVQRFFSIVPKPMNASSKSVKAIFLRILFLTILTTHSESDIVRGESIDMICNYISCYP